jgi:histone acetyltransferase (RNA polymerase elongator complex component)
VPHLGCPHACVFCDQRRISGQPKPVTPQDVRALVQQSAALPRSGAERQLAFYGGSFTAIPQTLQAALLEAGREAIESGLVDSLRLSTRPDAIDEGILKRLWSFGVRTIELGAQSMDEEVLRRSGRGHRAEDVRRAAGSIRNAGFELILQMMTGLPGDTLEKSLYTARELIDLKPDGVRIYPTVIVRGTELCELWQRGEYREHTVEEAVDWCARLLPLFDAAGIPVIRLGLNPTEKLSAGEAVAGAYHPALGELVKSRILLDRAREMLRTVPAGGSARLGVRRELLSQALGQHRRNLETLRREFPQLAPEIVPVGNAVEDLFFLDQKV